MVYLVYLKSGRWAGLSLAFPCFLSGVLDRLRAFGAVGAFAKLDFLKVYFCDEWEVGGVGGWCGMV